MEECKNVTLDLILDELKSIRRELEVVEHAVIPVEKLSASELAEHKRDLKQAQKEYREGKTKSIDEI